MNYGTYRCDFLGREKLILGRHKMNYGTKQGHCLGYWKMILVYLWRKLPRKVLYRRTFGAPDQGQTLDVWESQTTESALKWQAPYRSMSYSWSCLAGNVGNMSATCCPDSQMSALLADISLSRRHKTDSATVFLCRGLPTFTPFFLEYQRYTRRIPL